MASRGFGALARWKLLNGGARVPATFSPATKGVASLIRDSSIVKGTEKYGKGCYSSTRISSSMSYGRLTPEERLARTRMEHPRKTSKLTGEEIREFMKYMMASEREKRKNLVVTNQLLETLLKNTTPPPSGFLDSFVATWGYKLPPNVSGIIRVVIILALVVIFLIRLPQSPREQ